MNSRVFVILFLVSAVLFSGALFWAVKDRPVFDLNQHTSEQISGDFIAHISMGFARKDLQLVQMQQIEVVEEKDFAELLLQFPFLSEVKKIHVPVIYNYVTRIDDKIFLNKKDVKQLELTVGPLVLIEPILQLKDMRIETKDEKVFDIPDKDIQALLKSLRPLMEKRGEERKQAAVKPATEELTAQLSAWVRVKNLSPSPELTVHVQN